MPAESERPPHKLTEGTPRAAVGLLIQRRQGSDEGWLDGSRWGEVAEEPGGGDATVHEEVAAGDEPAVGAQKERGHGRDLVRVPPRPTGDNSSMRR
jgi:hypothetical protein